MRLLSLLCAIAALTSCSVRAGNGDDSTDAGPGMYDSIDVEPAQVTLSVVLGGSATQAYQVFGVVGTTRTDISSTCSLTLDSNFGTSNGTSITVGPHGGTTSIVASCGTQAGATSLTVNLSGTVVVGTSTPADAATIFAGATAGTTLTASSIEYPLDNAIAPLNIPPVEFQWTASGNDLFHISLTSTHAAIDVYTSDVQATLEITDWSAIAGTAAGGPLNIVVEGLVQATPTTKIASAPVSLSLSHDTIDTSAIYYWASSQGSIMSDTFGQTAAPTVVKANCSGCHSLSRAGTRLGYSRCVAGNCNTEWTGFMHFDPVGGWNEVVDADNETINGTYTTFSPVGNPFPDDSQSVALVTMRGGALNLYDPDTGTLVASNVGDVSTHGPQAPRSALMSDWSPDGNTIVYASVPGSAFVDLNNSSIATMSYTYAGGTHTFGEPNMLITPPLTLSSGSYTNLFFPSFSPDGQLIVFNAARASWRNFTTAAASGQRLMLSNSTGTGVVDLAALNGGDVDLDTTWPHWAPGETSDYYWVVFSSERNYGHEVTATNTAAPCVANGVKQCKQIWIGAIDKSKLDAGLTIDPSSPPMWLPGQDTQADNISPYWTLPAGIQ